MDSQGQAILFATEFGMGKSTWVDDFSTQHRGGKGVKCYKITDKTGDIVGAKCVGKDREIMLITNEGVIIRMNVMDVRVLGRITSGVKLMDIDRKSDVRIASIAKVREDIVDDSLPSEGGAPADYEPGQAPTDTSAGGKTEDDNKTEE
jgi:DNA gyrase subunit A